MKKWSWLVAPAIVIALAAAPAMAGGSKGRGHTSPTTAAGMTLSDTTPTFGEAVTISADYSIPSGVKYSVAVSVECVQSGESVYLNAKWTQDPAPFAPQFTLGPSSVSTQTGTYWWTGGGASCTAKLYYVEWKGQVETGMYDLASKQFEVT